MNPSQLNEKKTVSIALCGIGGYGEWYLKTLLLKALQRERDFRLAGVVDPYSERSSLLPELKEAHIPIFENLEQFYSKSRCDLLILATPIHLHSQQICLALNQGSHVLCEKPLCVTVDQIERMEAVEKECGKTVSIGYQWSFSAAIGKMKRDFLAGRFGAVQRLRALVCWPRDEHYYQRNSWAGKQRLDSGQLVLDSPVNNAAAHYLHNMLYVLGSDMATSALPKRVEAELWRANPIENYDTAALRLELESGGEVLFYASHATQASQGPSFIYEFEKAVVEYHATQGNLIARFRDGQSIDYGSPEAEPFEKIWQAIDSARTGRPSICGIAAAKAHTICVNWVQDSAEGIHDFPTSQIRVDHSGVSPRRYVENLQEIMSRCYAEGKLLGEDEAFVRLAGDDGA